MTSIPAISSSTPLPSIPQPLLKPGSGPQAPTDASAAATPDCDRAELKVGEAALAQMATTPLWSADFELPSIPALATPARTATGSFGSAASANSYLMGPGEAMASVRHSGSEGPSDCDSEDDEEFTMLEFLMFPAWSLLGGSKTLKEVENGAKEVIGAIGHGVQQVAGQIGQGVQQVVGQVGEALQGAASTVAHAASNAWKAITSFRLF